MSSVIWHFEFRRLVKDLSEDMTLLSVLEPTAVCAWKHKKSLQCLLSFNSFTYTEDSKVI